MLGGFSGVAVSRGQWVNPSDGIWYMREGGMIGSGALQQGRSIDLRIVEGPEGIREVANAWDDLFARATEAPPYLSRSWAMTFVDEGQVQGNPVFILAWCGTRLVALLPLAVRSILNTRVAVPIGTGQGAYLGLLLDPDYSFAVEAMADRIVSEKVFDVYYSADLSSEDAATHSLLEELTKRGYCRRWVLRNPCYCIRLGTSFDEYLKRKIPRGERRYKLRYQEKKLYKSGEVRVTRYVGRDITPEVNRRVAAIQLESWMKRRGGAVLGQPFYQTLMANMAEGGFGHVWVMTIDGDDAAFAYSFVAHGQHQYYWPAFKLKYESALSIGQMLLMHVIRDACQDGILLFDFVHGEAEYKRFWATDCYKVFRVVAGRGVVGRLITLSFYVFLQLRRVGWLHRLYRRMRTWFRRWSGRAA